MGMSLTRRQFLKLAALAPLVSTAPRLLQLAAQHAQAQPGRPNVLVIVFDTLSAKHMSLYGYPRQTTPNLDRFADRATVFHRHYAGGNFTSPGTSSLLTGSYAWSQRAFNFQGTVSQEYVRKSLFRLAGDAGYYRIAYTHNWLVAQLLDQFRHDIEYWKPLRELCLSDVELSDRLFPNDHDVAFTIERMMGLSSTYGAGSLSLSLLNRARNTDQQNKLQEKWKDLFPRGLPANGETLLFMLEDAIDWMKSELNQMKGPFFAYFHLLPPHAPYNARKDVIGRFDDDGFVEVAKPAHPLGSAFGIENVYRRKYDENIAYADAEFGRLYDFMVQAGIFENTVVVFTSDHGEMLERDTRGHLNPLLYEPITHIPLIISKPGQTKRLDVAAPTSCLDVFPTLARLIGQPVPDWCEGQILPTFGQPPTPGRSIYTIEAKSSAKQAPLSKATISLVKDQYKLIHYRGYDKGYDNFFELYDVVQDPEELNDLYKSQPGLASDLQNELLSKLAAANRPYQRT